VRPLSNFDGMKCYSLEAFQNLIDQLPKNHNTIPIAHNEGLSSLILSKDRHYMITFDDGLAEQANNCLEFLIEKRILNIYFIPTQPYSDGLTLPVHLAHYLLSKEDPEELISIIKEKLEIIIDQSLIESSNNRYKYGSVSEKLFKYIVNYYLEDKKSNTLINYMVSELYGDTFSNKYSQSLYMKPKALCELSSKTLIGYHSHSHKDYSRMTNMQVDKDIQQSKKVFQNLNLDSIYHAYPYGTIDSCPLRLDDLLRNNGIKYAFSTIRDYAIKGTDHLRIPRYDANDFIFRSN
tara:strand:- start:773 stop:1648 length:876 start_codon:yes stop_codon:yes gene_type:complete